jgi:hypothetical protein
VRLAVAASAALCFLAGCSPSKHVASAPVGLRTLPGLVPPHLTVLHRAHGTQPGYLFLAEKGGKRRPGGPVIADNRGRIVWYHQVPAGLEATDFRTQRYHGQPVLTWWQGTISKAGVGEGRYLVFDRSYRQVAALDAAHGLHGDLHEFQLTPRGTAYVTAYEEVRADLRAVGGPKDGWVWDSVVQELDLATGKPVFEWHSLDHVPLSESMHAGQEPARHATKKRPLDYFHVNSVSDAPDGKVLVSGRNTSAVYLLARDGSIVWRLGGKHSDFGPPAAVKFRFQHDAQLHPDGTLSLFDNGAIPKVEPFSRPLMLALDVPARRARIVESFVHPKRLLSPYEGNLQLLADGGALVGWGGVPRVTEFTPDGRVRFELKLPFGDTYRGYRLPWVGAPPSKPAVARDGDKLYASWNGETGIARWVVLAGADRAHLRQVASAPWAGLETAIHVAASDPTIVVRALGAHGRLLGASAPLGS